MIKNLIKKSLLLFSLVILAIYTVQSLLQARWNDTLFLWQLVFISVLICAIQLLMYRFKSNYYILELVAEYLMICIIVSLIGLIFGWFRISYLWNVFLYVTPVYIIGYFLDLSRTKRDLDFINEKIKQRAERGISNEHSNDHSEGS